MFHRRVLIPAVMLIFSFSGTILGQAPPNDDCVDAITIPDGDTPFETAGAGTDGPQPCGAIGADVWFLYVAPCDGIVQVSTCSLANYDTVLAAYDLGSGCPPPLGSELDCNDDSPGCTSLTSKISFTVVAGQEILIQVGGFAGSVGSGIINVQCYPPPPNDECFNAEVVGLGLTPFANVGATTDGPSPCSVLESDVWFLYTAPQDGILQVGTCNIANFDTVMALYDAAIGCVPVSGQEIACNDDLAGCTGLTSSITVPVSAGEYLIQLGGFNGEEGNGELLVSLATTAPPAGPCPAGGDSFSHSTDPVTVTPGNSAACQIGGVTLETSYWRTFDLDAFGVTGNIEITRVEIGVESAAPGAGLFTQPAELRIHSDTDANPANGLVEIGSEPFGIPVITEDLFCFQLTTPIVVLDSVSNVVVEVAIPDASASGSGQLHSFFIGSNPDPETDVSYISGSECGISVPIPVSVIGFDDMHIVMTVFYQDAVITDPQFIRGDFDGDAVFSGLVDALASLAFQFQGGAPPLCMEAADADGDGAYSGLIDALYTLAHQFQGGPAPAAPYPDCGLDPDPATSLGCDPNGC